MFTLQKTDTFLQYDENNGIIKSLKESHREYIGEETGIFRLAFRNDTGEQEVVEISDMRFKSGKKEESTFSAVYEGYNLLVMVSAVMTDQIEWNITIEQKDNRVLEWVDFPRFAVPNDLKDHGGQSKILWGFNEGVEVEDLSFKETDNGYKEPEYPTHPCAHLYPAMVQTQFLAYYNDCSGLYFGAHDRDGNLKGIDFYPYKKGIMLHMRHYCGTDHGKYFKLSYPMVMKFFQGGWQDASEIYRKWFEDEGKIDILPITENKRLPNWYSESPVVVTYPVRGTYDTDDMTPNKMYPYCNAMEHIERLEEEFNSKILVLLMHWEGTAPWAPPYVWPPYGGEEELKKFIDVLHDRGDLIGVYCSGIGWTQYSKLVDDYNREMEFGEKNLKEVMCLSPKQELLYSDVVPHIRAGYDMCPAQRFTVDVLREQVKCMVSAGIDYIQLLDQNSGGTAYFCYGKNHGHPSVPGKWQVDAVRNMLAEIEQETGEVLLGTEAAAAESYIPYLLFSDNRFGINYSVGRPVPVYAYLFHEYVNNFMGNQVWMQGHINFKKSPDNVLERLAYSFSAGDMLTVVLNEDGAINWCWDCDQFVDDLPEQQSIKDFVRNLNMWRQGFGKKYLHTGKMAKPYPVKSGEHVIYCQVKDHETVIDKIHTSAWLTKDGSYGQFLVNYNTEDIECSIELPAGSYRLYENENTFRVLTGGSKKVYLKKITAVLLERE